MNGVLLLDVQCRPLRVISTKRAVALLMSGRAEPMADEIVAEMRSASTSFAVPAVLRLGYSVKLPFTRKGVPCTKRGVLARDGHICQFVTSAGPCSATAETVDHLHPSSRGGLNSWTNLVGACGTHNHKKGDRTLEEIGWKLKKQPTEPRAQVRVAGAHGHIPASWQPFLATA